MALGCDDSAGGKGHSARAANWAPMVNVWIDTDIGDDIDDAVALLAAARHPEMELVGVSTVYGDVGTRAWLAREQVTRAGANIPVLPGAMRPLTGRDLPAARWSYNTVAPELPQPSADDDDRRVDAIAGAMGEVAAPFCLVTIGAMTNAAKLVTRHPGLRDLWRGVVCMAGRLEGDPEWNVYCDPLAAKIVCEELAPRLIGLEACSDRLPKREVEQLVDPSDRASAFFLECYKAYRNVQENPNDDAPLTLFDPISVLSLVAPEAFNLQDVRVSVDAEGRLRLTDDGFPVTYALSSDWSQTRPMIEAVLRNAF